MLCTFPKENSQFSFVFPGSKIPLVFLSSAKVGTHKRIGTTRIMSDFHRRTLPSRSSLFLDNGSVRRYNFSSG